MALSGKNNEEKIWNYLKAAGLSDGGAAGLMGNLYAESALSPINLQNGYEKKLGYTDETYTAAVDSGAYTNFAKDSAGYGLAQWTYSTRKAALLAYAQQAGKSVGDLETQLGFLMKEMAESFKSVLATLKSTGSVREASDAVLTKFERPADQSTAAKTRRAGYGQTYYDRYVAKETGGAVTEQELRQRVCDIINGWVGATRGSAKHLEILAIYNGYKPLARGYPMKVSDAHCAATTSAAYIKAGIAPWTGTECGVEKYVNVAKGKGIWIEDDAHVPKLGEACVYDWDDDGKGDDTGAGDHIGIVTETGGGSFTVTEGNMSGGKVGTREMKVNGRYIRGFIAPDFAKIATELSKTGAGTQPETGSTGGAGETVYTVVKGDTLSDIAARFGTTYQKLAEYNGISNPNIIHVGQKIRIPGKAAAAQPRTYTVVRGDSLWGIAAKQLGNGTRYTEIMKLNGLTSTVIYAGQVLKLPG